MTKSGWKTARKIRVVFSLAFLVLISLVFLDPWHLIPNAVASYITSVEIVPGLLKLIVAGSIVSAIGFVVVVLVTLLFGRIYCSTICPLGTLQDLSNHFAKKINRRKRFKFSKPIGWLQYSVLTISVAIVLFGGSMMVVGLLEPFSNYGRLMTTVGLPPIILANNLFAFILTHFGNYFLYDIPLHVAGIGTFIFTLLFFVTIVYMSAVRGRLFCNSFCPAGGILSLISRISLFKLVIKEDSCNDCGACDRVCKAECIDSKNRRIDFSACIGCFNCLRSCPKDGIVYSMKRYQKFAAVKAESAPAGSVLQSRRELLRNVGVPAAALLLAPGIVESGVILKARRQGISPPGSLGIRHFTSICTACHLCVASCPTNVLRPSFLEYGLSGVSQPLMDYDYGYCNYDCVICGRVCPTGAILKTTMDEKKRIQIGKANFVKDDCIVVSKKKDCAACSEHCPTKAVHTIPYEGNLLLPEVDDEICIGCGACEHVCPATPRKAIKVNANLVHLTAKKPKTEEPSRKNQAPITDFPF